MNTIKKGHLHENIAVNYLINKGFTLIKKNYVCREGEIDLIMKKNNEIVFFEVKSLSINSPFFIYETLTRKKKARLKRAIYRWISENDLSTCIWRVDFLGVLNDRGLYKIEHFEFIDLETYKK